MCAAAIGIVTAVVYCSVIILVVVVVVVVVAAAVAVAVVRVVLFEIYFVQVERVVADCGVNVCGGDDGGGGGGGGGCGRTQAV